uniref:LRRNT domain-containing protein n=1 Tax=Amphiprion percula TaxID=161767 RepID=A0A3P8TWV7_AMPPE
MHPIAAELLGESNVGGSRWNPAVLFLLCFGFIPSVATCPPYCLCNSISRIEVNAFNVTPHLFHLDLSSNQLTVLNSSIFTGLRELKELLLFGNQIVQINPGAFSDLHGLQKLYLSTNRLTAFPLGLYEEPGGPRNLTFLDLSNNRLSKVPIQSLLLITRQGGIYLQENPLVCDCALLKFCCENDQISAATLPFKSLGSLRNVLIFERKAVFSNEGNIK